jgi:hypothetical protein
MMKIMLSPSYSDLYPGRDFPPERLTSFSRAGNPQIFIDLTLQ